MAESRNSGWVGKAYQRKQDPRFLTGRGVYTDDIEIPGMLYGAILGSSHAHARIKHVNVDAAAKLPGVIAVLTGKQAAQMSEPLPPVIALPGMRLNSCHAVAADKVRYMGEPVAAVAAIDRYIAEDALELIEVEYEPLPAITNVEQALAPGAPLLYEDWPSNVAMEFNFRAGDVDKALAQADYVIEESFPHHRYSGAPMEGRAVVADFDPVTGEMTAYVSTQSPHQCRTLFSQILRIPEQKIRVIAPAIGGGFGNKIQVHFEVIPCMLSMLAGRPVKWMESRSQHMLSCVHSRDYVCKLTVGFRKDGTILGMKANLTGDIGCDGTNRAAGVGALTVASVYMPGPYKISNYAVDTIGVVTNKAPYGAYRGYGKDVANFPVERMLEIAARKLRISSREIRDKNFIQPEELPYEQCSGPLYDSGDYPLCLSRVLELIDYDGVRKEQQRVRREGTYLGVGFAAMLEPSGGAVPNCIFNGYEAAVVRVTPEGGVTLLTGIQEIGQGIETTMAQIVADELTIDPDNVKVLCGDTAIVPYGLGSWSSRGAAYGGSSALEASRKVKDKILRIGAFLMKTRLDDVELKDGRVTRRDSSGQSLSIAAIARQVYLFPGPYVTLPEGLEPSLEATAYWTSPIVRWVPDDRGTLSIYTNHPCGALAAVVEVDIETGQIKVLRFAVSHDAGTIINPMILDGQVHGGVVQGIAGILSEELQYDQAGNLLNTNFQDYLVPIAPDLPDIEVTHLVSPSPFTPTGAKGMGEGGTIASPAAIVNAVENALAPFGVTIRETPLTPERILNLIREAKARQTAGAA
ncbi:MAG: xanthine dehydrogenase family protein molybdopterin-binding subunit [Candidatus Binataceae bacterium]|jgi:carbon-monoxide dehydrogenase large subunit